MDEIRADYYESQREKNLAKRKPIYSKSRLPTEKELQASCSPVLVIQYPDLQSLPERLKYLQKAESTASFSQRCGVSMKAYYRLLNGQADTTQVLKKVAEATGCPLEWLKGAKKKSMDTALISNTVELPHYERLFERVHWVRGEKKLSIEKLCRILGWNTYKFNKVIHKSIAYRDTVMPLAEALEVPFEWLTEGLQVFEGEIEIKSPSTKAKEDKKNSTGIHLNIEGKYTPEQLTAILSGFGGQSFYVRLELSQ